MKQTENLALNLPEGPDNYDVNDYNENFEIIDEKMKYLADHIGGGGVLEEKTIYTNGIYTPPEGVDGWNKIIAAVTPALMNRTIYENGTYTASQETPVSYDGYGTVIVDVQPSEILISEFQFAESIIYDKIKKCNLATNMHTGFGNGKIAARNNKLFTGNYLNIGTIIKAEIKLGTFDRNIATTDTSNTLINLVSGNNHFMLMWREDLQYWQFRDASGNMGYLQNITSKYYFENKTIIVFFGAKYVDGKLYREYNGSSYENHFSLWVDDGINMTELIEDNGEITTGDTTNTIPMIRLGSRGSDSLVGAVFESVKVYQYFDKYEAPASLMMAAPGEAEELRAEIEEEPEAEEIKQEEEKETEETKEAGLLKNEKSEEGQKSEAE